MTTIRTALLSYGMSGKLFHAPFIHVHEGYTLVGSWERSKKLIEGDYPGSRSYSSLEEVLGDEGVDLVIVNTPTSTHYDFARQALQAGKHVVVEKAFTTNANEAVELVGMARNHKRVLSVYQNRRWDSDFMAVQKILRDGAIGDVTEAQISYDRYNLGLSPKLHKETPGPGGGNLIDLGPHVVDQALVLFGMPDAVFADLRSCRPESKVDDYFEILLYYPALRVRLKSSHVVREPGPAYLIHGTKGTLKKYRSDTQEGQLKGGMSPNDAFFGIEPPAAHGMLYKIGIDSSDSIESTRGNYRYFYDQLYLAITTGAPPPVTGEEGIKVMRILDAAADSYQRKCVVGL